MRYPYKHYIYLATAALMLLSTSCKKLVEVDPPKNSTNGGTVYAADETASAVLTGIYTTMSKSGLTSGGTINSFMPLYPGLSADELVLNSLSNKGDIRAYYTNTLTNTNASLWTVVYPVIYICNSAIEGLTNNKNLTPSIQKQLLGEAKFLRALHYFYLVNLYGDVPLILTTDYTTNSTASRTPKDQVYQQIITDLKEAQQLLSSDYLSADILTTTPDRLRPTTWAATALLARVYLYLSKWSDAETQSSTLIGKTGTFQLSNLDHAFLMAQSGNNEAIWQLQPVNLGWNTEDARVFIIPSGGPDINHPVYLSSFLLNSFEASDLRRTHWVDSITIPSGSTYFFANKYKSAKLNDPVTEHEMVFRLGEQYLIRSEARANQSKLDGNDGAISDLNVIRQRAGVAGYAGPINKDSVLKSILHERQIELFTEWGHRWLDLKRTGSVDSVMTRVTPLKGGTWNSNWQLYPIPLTELTANPNLTPNPGY